MMIRISDGHERECPSNHQDSTLRELACQTRSASRLVSPRQDNINCMIAGEKRFVFMHPSYKEAFEAGGVAMS